MKRLLVIAALLASTAAHAQAPAQPVDDGMVVLPRTLVQDALNWIASPDPTVAVKLYALLNACVSDNPQGGTVIHQGQDQCSAVTSALAARDKQIADLKAEAEKAKAVPAVAVPLP